MYILKEGFDYEGEWVLGIYDTKEQAEKEFLARILEQAPYGTFSGCEYVIVTYVEKNAPRGRGSEEVVFNSSDYAATDCWYYVQNVVNSIDMPDTLEGLKALSDKLNTMDDLKVMSDDLDRQREEAFRAYHHEARFEGYKANVTWH